MKRIIWILLGILLMLGVCLLPAAAEDAAEPEPTAQTQTETTAPEPAVPESHKPLSPYQSPRWEDYDGDNAAYAEDLQLWRSSIYSRYYNWRSSMAYARAPYDPAFRAFYAADPDLHVENHFVFSKVQAYVYEGHKRVKRTIAVIYDYFDTDEAEQACTTLRIPATLDGCPAVTYMYYRLNDDTDAAGSIGYTNDTVKKVVLEEGLHGIGDYALSGFTALKTVYLPSSVMSVNRGAFKDCRSLKKVVVRGILGSIGSRAFENCEKLRVFDGLENVGTIEGRAFAGSGLRSITLSGSTLLGWGDEDADPIGYNFAGCKQLKTVCFTDSIETFRLEIARGCFQGCTALRTVTLPTVCRSIAIDEYAFADCTALNAVQKVTKLKRVYSKAFRGCTALDTFVLPKEIEFAEADAFAGCSGLTRFFVNSKNPDLLKYEAYDDGDYRDRTISGNFLLSLPKTCTIYVPNREMKAMFKSAGFPGAVKIRVSVSAPKTVKAVKQNGKVTISWSKVKICDGYRVWAYDAKTGKYTKLATVKAGVRSVTVKSNAKQFAVRAFRNETGDISWSKLKVCSVQ